MTKTRLSVFCGALVGAAILAVGTTKSHAIPPFEKEFKDIYYKPDSTDPNEKALAAELDGLGTKMCNACHVGTSKKNRNAYGFELDKLLDKKADKDNAEKIRESLKKVAAMKSKSDDPNSPTFGDLMKQGKLPSDGTVVEATSAN
jgi:hypothetical protein